MIPYTPPLNDIRFVLKNLVGLDRLAAMRGYDSATEDMVDAVLEEAGKLASGAFAPLNYSGDHEGSIFNKNDGTVTTPKGFREAYKAYVEGGWNSLPVDAEQGGQGLPWSVAMPVQEMLESANMALALCTLLNQGATELLAAHGSAALKATYLPKMLTGEWTGTMNITEPQAGSDVGAIHSRAVKSGDHYLITGQKIFISYGEHDLAENIIHFVLARLPDAPEGTRGLTLFLVPKFLVNADGSLGKRNDAFAVSMEHKLGQHAGPTCVMAFGDNGGAEGYLIGEENGGIAAMFVMMNNARVGVGVQGLAAMERSYQQARDYAMTRVQSRPIEKPKDAPVAVIRHPDVRRMLMHMRACSEAARALAYSCALAIDTGKCGTEAEERKRGEARADLLTPMVKAWVTDTANEVTSIGVQVCGGMGYIEDTGILQHMRDARVLTIYEGTNGIQSNDLAFRKIARDGGAELKVLMGEIDACLAEMATFGNADGFDLMHRRLTDARSAFGTAADWVIKNAVQNPAIVAAGAVPFMRLAGNTVAGYFLIKSAVIAHKALAKGNAPDATFLKEKQVTALFFASHILPQCPGLAATVIEGNVATLAFDLVS